MTQYIGNRNLPGTLLSAAIILAAALSVHAAEAERHAVRPSDTGRALVNPAMGWTLHYYSNIPTNYGSRLEPSDTLEDFPGLSVIYLRVPWGFLEPEEGHFNWSLVDTPAQRWIDRGKQIALRFTCSESWTRWATPKWVHDAGAKGVDFTTGQGVVEGGHHWEPDYNDPIFIEKLDRFLAAMAARYDGNPNVAFIDIGSFGVWGEGHTHASSRIEYDLATRKRHIDLHCKHFKKTLLAVSDDFAGHDTPGARLPITDYVLAKGVTLRDDSICVQPPPRSYYHAELAQAFWPTLPVVLEHEHYGSSKARGAWGDGSLVAKSVEEYHAAYMSIHWWPHEFLEANRELIDRVNLRLGYRIQLTEASWPVRVRLGEEFRFSTKWKNAGVAPCYPGAYAALTLKDAQGGIVAVCVDPALDMRDLRVGAPGAAPEQALESTFAIARETSGYSLIVQPGHYDLFISTGAPDGTPKIALPLENGDGKKRYKLGSVELLSREEK